MQRKISNYCLKIAIISLMLWGGLFFTAGPSEAVQLIKKYDIKVPAGKTIEGPVLAAGKTVYIDGTIDGDLYVFSSDVKINGVIKGDLLAIAANIEINGTIEGNLRTLCGTADISGRVEENVSLLGSKINLNSQGIIGKSLLLGALQAELQGEIKNQVCGWGSNVKLRGNIGQGITFFKVGNLTINSGSKVEGDVRYSSINAASISPGATITEEVQWDKKQPQSSPLSTKLLWTVAGLLVWWFLNLLFPGFWNSIVSPAVNRPVAAASWGIAVFLIVPLMALLLLFTVIGVPLALMFLAFYAAIVYMGKIIAGCTLGYILGRRFNFQGRIGISPSVWFLTSYLGIVVLGSLPFAGLFVNVLSICWALGVIVWLFIYKRRQIIAGLRTENQ